jgi:hypothetical protein
MSVPAAKVYTADELRQSGLDTLVEYTLRLQDSLVRQQAETAKWHAAYKSTSTHLGTAQANLGKALDTTNKVIDAAVGRPYRGNKHIEGKAHGARVAVSQKKSEEAMTPVPTTQRE